MHVLGCDPACMWCQGVSHHACVCLGVPHHASMHWCVKTKGYLIALNDICQQEYHCTCINTLFGELISRF